MNYLSEELKRELKVLSRSNILPIFLKDENQKVIDLSIQYFGFKKYYQLLRDKELL